jgi:3D-(3,5/4)-trihydroxycyclohexane-1,2-dione acylhydrolase (decyclizing)
VFAIFGHGNVAGLGPALHAARRRLPTLRAHNEQAMAHAAIAFAKAHCAPPHDGLHHVDRPGREQHGYRRRRGSRQPPAGAAPSRRCVRQPPARPVLQQLEAFGDPTLSVNDCFRPVSRLFRPHHAARAAARSLPAALRVLLDPEECGPVTLALPQDVQTEAYDYPAEFFPRRVHRIRRPLPDGEELAAALQALKKSRKPLIICGRRREVRAGREAAGRASPKRTAFRSARRRRARAAWPGIIACNVGCDRGHRHRRGQYASPRARIVVLAVGARLGDFATGSRALFADARWCSSTSRRSTRRSTAPSRWSRTPMPARSARSRGLSGWKAPAAWTSRRGGSRAHGTARWRDRRARPIGQATDAQVLGAVNAAFRKTTVSSYARQAACRASCTSCGARATPPAITSNTAISCMGYEIAGGLGVKLAQPDARSA